MPAPNDLGPTIIADRTDDIGITDAELSEITDAELSDLALAADPDAPLEPDAVPFDLYLGGAPGLLPGWYMPRAMARGARWRTVVVVVLIAAFLLIDAAGLCSTYGHITIA